MFDILKVDLPPHENFHLRWLIFGPFGPFGQHWGLERSRNPAEKNLYVLMNAGHEEQVNL